MERCVVLMITASYSEGVCPSSFEFLLGIFTEFFTFFLNPFRQTKKALIVLWAHHVRRELEGREELYFPLYSESILVSALQGNKTGHERCLRDRNLLRQQHNALAHRYLSVPPTTYTLLILVACP